jgi:D-Tyr-tRNAtyr deacylase
MYLAWPMKGHVPYGVRALGISTAAGRVGAMMQVELINDGPVTLLVVSK